jgi:hypothetical protein
VSTGSLPNRLSHAIKDFEIEVSGRVRAGRMEKNADDEVRKNGIMAANETRSTCE